MKIKIKYNKIICIQKDIKLIVNINKINMMVWI
jgi:hypothetical protein